MHPVLAKLLEMVVAGLVIAPIASFLTVRYSLRSFYSQKWWERKADTYSRILEALYQMKDYAEELMDCEMRGKGLPEEREEQLRARWQQGRDEVRKATAVGAFVISEDASKHLDKLRQALDAADEERSFYDQLDSEVAALNECIIQMGACAKKDLQVA